jgi:hypothetical protein
MIKSFLFVIAVGASQVAMAANHFDYKMEIKSRDFYTIVDGNTAIGSHSEALVQESITGQILGKTIDQVGVPTGMTQSMSHVSLTNISKDTVVYNNQNEKLVKVLPAQVKKSFFTRKIEGMTISSDVMKSVLASSLEKQGSNLVSKFGLLIGKSTLNYALDLTDYSCVRSNAMLVCESEAQILMSYR